MILNFNNQAKFFEQSLALDISNDFLIKIVLDSNNKVFKVKYFCAEDFVPYFEFISDYILDKNLDELYVSLAHDIYGIIEKKNYLFDAYLLDWSLFQFKLKLNELRGASNLFEVDPEEIICRCNGIDLKAIEEEYLNYKGSIKDFVKKSNAGMICGNCKNDISLEFNRLSKKNLFHEGKTPTELIEEIHIALFAFKDYSAQELDKVTISNIDLDFPQVHFQVQLLDTNFDEKLLEVNLTNYLCSKLKMALEVKLTVV